MGQGVPDALTRVPFGHKSVVIGWGQKDSVILFTTPGNSRTKPLGTHGESSCNDPVAGVCLGHSSSLTAEGAGDRAYVFGEVTSQGTFGIKLLLRVL